MNECQWFGCREYGEYEIYIVNNATSIADVDWRVCPEHATSIIVSVLPNPVYHRKICPNE